MYTLFEAVCRIFARHGRGGMRLVARLFALGLLGWVASATPTLAELVRGVIVAALAFAYCFLCCAFFSWGEREFRGLALRRQR